MLVPFAYRGSHPEVDAHSKFALPGRWGKLPASRRARLKSLTVLTPSGVKPAVMTTHKQAGASATTSPRTV